MVTATVIPVYDSKIQVTQWLDKYNIPYTTEQEFPGLNGYYGPLRFDIYLPNHRMCIEVDGQQHYLACKNDNIEAFLKKREYARRKEKFCLDHSIRLIRFVYDELPYLDRVLGSILNVKTSP